MISCKKDDTLKDVILKLDSMKIHRIYVVDDEGKLEGLITLRDIISRSSAPRRRIEESAEEHPVEEWRSPQKNEQSTEGTEYRGDSSYSIEIVIKFNFDDEISKSLQKEGGYDKVIMNINATPSAVEESIASRLLPNEKTIRNAFLRPFSLVPAIVLPFLPAILLSVSLSRSNRRFTAVSLDRSRYKNKLKFNKTDTKGNSGMLHKFQFHFLRTKQTLELIPIPFSANQTTYGIGILFLTDSFSISNILRTKQHLRVQKQIPRKPNLKF
ncbi:hypothetical protein LXL04_006792 [Taraxacum kok-saghyz]